MNQQPNKKHLLDFARQGLTKPETGKSNWVIFGEFGVSLGMAPPAQTACTVIRCVPCAPPFFSTVHVSVLEWLNPLKRFERDRLHLTDYSLPYYLQQSVDNFRERPVLAIIIHCYRQ